MQNCIWLQPETVAQFRFLEWTPADHLRHVSFVGLREDKEPQEVVKEGEQQRSRKPPRAVYQSAAGRRAKA